MGATNKKIVSNSIGARNMPAPRILIADDFPDTVEILSTLLRKTLGAEIFTAKNGAEALRVFEGERPDLSLLDVNMPEMTGIEVCRRIKEMSVGIYSPVVLITALTDGAAKSRGFAAGADDYVTKPFDPYEVDARVRAMLRTKELQDQLLRTQSDLTEANRELRSRVQPLFTMKPRRKEVTVLFSDIRNFTQIADQLDPEDVQEMLDAYLGEMGAVIQAHGGVINKVMGDGLMVLFNDPTDQPDHQMRAMMCGLQMRQRALALQARLHEKLPEPFTIGIGINTGEAIVGRIGNDRISDYTAVGSVVNLASRLQTLSTNNQVVAAFATYGAMSDQVELRDARRETLRGLAHPVRVAEIVGLRKATVR